MSTVTVLPFGGGEMGSFDPSTNAVVESVGASHNATYARCAIDIPSGNWMTSPTWTAASTFWFHADLAVGLPFDPATDGYVLQFLNGANEVMRMTATGETSMTWKFYTRQSAVMTLAGSFTVPTFGVGYNTYDFGIVAGGAGTFSAYSAGTQMFSVIGLDHSSWSGVTQVKLFSCGDAFGASTDAAWSQVICDSTPHIGDRLWTYPIDTNSAVNTGWTGDVSDIDEIVYNDANFIGAPSAALVRTFFANGFNLGAKNIVAVLTGSRAKKAATGPSALKNTIRVNGANASGPTINLDVGFQACCNSWTTNPTLGGAWVAANAQTVEAGDTSVT